MNIYNIINEVFYIKIKLSITNKINKTKIK